MNWLCVQGCAVFLEGPTPQNWQEERTTLGGAREPSFLLPLLLGKALKSRRRIDRAKSSWGLAMASGGWGHLTRHPGEPRPPASPQTPGCIQGGGFQGCCSLAFLHQYGTSFLLARSSVARPRPPRLIPSRPCRQPLARFPSYRFLKDNRPRQAEWEVSSDVYSGSHLPGPCANTAGSL